MRRTVLVSLLLLGASACGIPGDDRPRSLPDRDLALLTPSSTTTTTQLDDEEADAVEICLVSDDAAQLAAATRMLPKQPGQGLGPVANRLDDALRSLLDGPQPDERRRGISSALPRFTSVRSTSVDGRNRVRVDLSKEFQTTDAAQLLAVAQVVCTVDKAVPGAEVTLAVGGRTARVPVANGEIAAGAVTVEAYAAILPGATTTTTTSTTRPRSSSTTARSVTSRRTPTTAAPTTTSTSSTTTPPSTDSTLPGNPPIQPRG